MSSIGSWIHSAIQIYRAYTYFETWNGFEAAKTAPWRSRGLHHLMSELVEMQLLPDAMTYPIKNLRRVLGVSLENYFSPLGHAWHLLPWFFHGQLTDFPLENYSTLCVVVCGHRWFTVFHNWNMDHYRGAATGECPESMEVYPNETPWTVPEIRR